MVCAMHVGFLCDKAAVPGEVMPHVLRYMRSAMQNLKQTCIT
jgi:hypothetical protein